MKKIISFFAMGMVAILLTGCSAKMFAILGALEAHEDRENKQGIEKQVSKLDSLSSTFSIAYKAGEIAYLTDLVGQVEFYNEETQEKKTVQLPDGYESLQITAGDNYFYVYCYDGGNEDYPRYLRMYDTNAEFIKEVKLPFQMVLASDGIIFGYYDKEKSSSDIDGFSWFSSNSNSHIEATHYIREEDFIDTYPKDIGKWTKMKGEKELNIDGKIMYPCSKKDINHTVQFYSNEKPMKALEQICYVRYCNGDITSDETDKFVKDRLEQIYYMMHEKEENFAIYSFQNNNQIYGVCNVYSVSTGILSDLLTDDVEYSFVFRYDESQDTLCKVKEYDKLELVYTDGEHLLTHKMDGIYYQNLQTAEEKKVYDYDGAFVIVVVNGCVKFQESVIHYNDNTEDVQVVKKLW